MKGIFMKLMKWTSKLSNLKLVIALSCTLGMLQGWGQTKNPIIDHDGGGTQGGGGDVGEMRVEEIAADILKWINEDGAKDLRLPQGLSYQTYVNGMKKYLAPKYVYVEFTDDENLVQVRGKKKTCRQLESATNAIAPNILCHTAKFFAASDAEQYRLIHHEYAGLAGLEKNIGKDSDYIISQQITGFLEATTVLRLAVKSPSTYKECTPSVNVNSFKSYNYRTFADSTIIAEELEKGLYGIFELNIDLKSSTKPNTKNTSLAKWKPVYSSTYQITFWDGNEEDDDNTPWINIKESCRRKDPKGILIKTDFHANPPYVFDINEITEKKKKDIDYDYSENRHQEFAMSYALNIGLRVSGEEPAVRMGKQNGEVWENVIWWGIQYEETNSLRDFLSMSSHDWKSFGYKKISNTEIHMFIQREKLLAIEGQTPIVNKLEEIYEMKYKKIK